MTTTTPRPVAFCDSCNQGHADQLVLGDGQTERARICPDCVQELKQLLGSVPELLRDLDVALSRQSRIGTPSGRKGHERPLPYDPAASEATAVLLAHTITRWALDVWRHARMIPGQGWGATRPPDNPVVYLVAVLDRIRTRRYAATMLDEIRAAVTNAREVIDLSKDYLEAGTCPTCSARLLARPGDVQITCRRCGARWGVQERRSVMLADAEGRWLTATQCERLVDVFLRHGTTDRIRKRVPAGSVRGWASKGLIEPRGLNEQGSPLYRLGDVLDRALVALAAA